MKVFIALIILLLFLVACRNSPNTISINKGEAKNRIIDGLKEGKWIEYTDEKGSATSDTNAPFYTIYTYKSGKKTGTAKQYDKDGVLLFEIPYVDDKINGNVNEYYKSGAIKSVTGYNNGNKGVRINYDENGNPTYSVTVDSTLLRK